MIKKILILSLMILSFSLVASPEQYDDRYIASMRHGKCYPSSNYGFIGVDVRPSNLIQNYGCFAARERDGFLLMVCKGGSPVSSEPMHFFYAGDYGSCLGLLRANANR